MMTGETKTEGAVVPTATCTPGSVVFTVVIVPGTCTVGTVKPDCRSVVVLLWSRLAPPIVVSVAVLETLSRSLAVPVEYIWRGDYVRGL